MDGSPHQHQGPGLHTRAGCRERKTLSLSLASSTIDVCWPELRLSALNSQLSASPYLFVIQDRLAIAAANKSRFLEATETALHFGKGEVYLFAADAFAPAGHFSRGLHSPKTGRTFRAATPGLFSFNSPLGACPKCRGFGRVIDIDYRLAIPDHSLSIDDGAIRPWEGEIYGESKKDLLQFTRKLGIPTNVPFAALTPAQQAFIIDGEPGYGEENGKQWPKYWYGLKGFFPLPREEDLQDARAGLPLALPGLQPVPRLRRRAAPARGALLEMARPHPARSSTSCPSASC